MITNINLIKSVGKFEDCNLGDITFTDRVLIFGKNMYGKSTLTSIFSSLKDMNNDLVIGRKRFGSTSDPEIIIKIGGDNFIFRNNSWNKEYKNLEIFDTKFITENICNTENILYNQQENLNKIILGGKGHVLVNEITMLTEKISELSSKKRELTNNYFNPILVDEMTLDKFLSSSPLPNVDIEIEKQEEIIRQIKNKQKIIIGISNSFFKLDLESFEKVLDEEVHVDFKKIQFHLQKNFDDITRGKIFLQEGITLLKNDNCIFCGQNLNESANKLIDCYKEVFSNSFRELQKNMNLKIDEFLSLNFEDKINKEILEFKELGLQLNLSKDDKESIFKNKKIIDKIFYDKKLDIMIKIDLNKNSNWIFIKSKFNEIKKDLDMKEKGFFVDSDIIRKEKRLKELKLTKTRFTKPTLSKINEYNRYSKEIEKFQLSRTKKQKELKEYANTTFERYGEIINNLLKEMGSNFKIDNFSHLKKLRGRNESLFCINFDSSHKVDIYGDNSREPNFMNTLSESDKRTLAFAFFLAKLSVDENLHEKIIIFDDPISSFDRERKRKTCYLLLDINCDGKRPKQIIALTHQEDFLKSLKRDLDSFDMECTVLKLFGGNIKFIQDIDKEFPDDEILDLLGRLKKILINETFEEDFFVSCRKVLENIMRKKYFIKLQDINQSNPRASIRTYAEEIYPDKEEQFYKNLIRIFDDIQVPLHNNSLPAPSTGDKKSILQDFFDILEKI